jgi:hypothetical protein
MQAIVVLRDSRFLMIVAIAIALLNVPLNLLGLVTIGVPGIALTSSVLHVAGWLAAEFRLRTLVGRFVPRVPETVQ